MIKKILLSVLVITAPACIAWAQPMPTHSYTFEDETPNDSVGDANGVLVGGAGVVGGALVTSAQGQWMEMPGDIIDINSYEAVTIEAWYIPTDGANTSWTMLAYFGDTVNDVGANGFFVTSARGDDVSRAAISVGNLTAPYSVETGVNGPEYDDGQLHYIATTINNIEITLYIDGELMGIAELSEANKLSGISNNYVYLAKSGYTSDPTWIGAIEEFNIYNVALSQDQIVDNYLKGPVSNLTHSYTFEDGTPRDVVGDANGVLVGGAEIVGGALVTVVQDQWMALPGEIIDINSYDEVTIEAWYTPEDGANTSWTMLAYFGDTVNGVGANGFFITSARGDDVSRAAISVGNLTAPYSSETGVNGPEYDDGVMHFMASTINATDITLFIDGELIGTAALDPNNKLSGVSNRYAYLAKSGYDADPEWIGKIEEFNIYNKALSADQLTAHYLSGPKKVGPQPVDPGYEGLVAYYPLNSVSRGVTADVSGNGLDGIIFDEPVVITDGVVGGALMLDGVDDYVDCGNDPLFDITEQITLSLWINTEDIGTLEDNPWVGKGDHTYMIKGFRDDNIIEFFVYEDTWTTSHAVVGDSFNAQWHHVAGTFDGAQLKIYVDGELAPDSVVDYTGGIGVTTFNVAIGTNTEHLDRVSQSTFDEVRIFNRALSDAEIAFLASP